MPVNIPTRTDSPHFDLDCTLEGTVYHFDFDWNDRDAGWYMSIATIDGVPLATGRRVVVNFPFLGRFKDPRLPSGTFIAFDTLNTDTDPGVNELGSRVQLIYYTAAEMAAVLAGN